VPSAVLYAVALQESGAMLRGRLIPGRGRSTSPAAAALRHARRGLRGLHRALAHTPANRIDAGLGQVNLGYHAHRYTQPCELLDPYRNLAIAAEILRSSTRRARTGCSPSAATTGPPAGRPPPATGAVCIGT
jgi:hypothetical protein